MLISVPVQDVKTRQITIWQVEAETVGNRYLGIHRTTIVPGSPNRALGHWTVTHIPSGFVFFNDFPNKEAARACAQWINLQNLKLDGDHVELQASASAEFKAWVKQMRTALLNVEDTHISMLRAIDVPLNTESYEVRVARDSNEFNEELPLT